MLIFHTAEASSHIAEANGSPAIDFSGAAKRGCFILHSVWLVRFVLQVLFTKVLADLL